MSDKFIVSRAPATIRFTCDIDDLLFVSQTGAGLRTRSFNKGEEISANLSPGDLGSVNLITDDGIAFGVDAEAFEIIKPGIPPLP